jgi:hypothetical protein
MTFKFACPACGQRVSATEDFIGTQAACPTCGASFIVEAPADDVAMAAAGPPALPAQPPPLPPADAAVPVSDRRFQKLLQQGAIPLTILGVISLPSTGILGAAVIGGIMGALTSLLLRGIGIWIDTLRVRPVDPGSASASIYACVGTTLALGTIGLVAWLLPVAGGVVAIVGYYAGWRARFSALRRLALIGMALCLVTALLSMGNSYVGARLAIERALAAQHP